MTKVNTVKEALLLLEDGTYYKGLALGKIGTSGGEICFNTGMTGYQEIYTDPSYFGQVIVNTNSHIGNYGVMVPTEEESASVTIKGLVCNEFAHVHSRLLADESLQQYFEKAGIVGIYGVDTRQIVRHIRSKGAMNCIISSDILDVEELKKELLKVPQMAGSELSSIVSTTEPYYLGNPDAKHKVAALDFGIKKSILSGLTNRDCYVKVFPAKTSFQELSSWGADGYFISNGPGDPSVMGYAIETVKEILASDKPLFGICLGHQLLAQASGVSTYKMHHGHRGLNHPVKNLVTGLSEITSQNHGFAVNEKEVYANELLEVTHLNLNDQTIEGIRRKDKKAFSVQHHPEASPGPHDSRYLFDTFVEML
jgi:carbamoyl-phosphate synthase small subunit